MLLPDNVPEFRACDTYDWGERENTLITWRGLIRRSQISFMRRRRKAKLEARLARMIATAQGDRYTGATDPMLIERLEAQLAAADDAEIRRLFAKYLSEP